MNFCLPCVDIEPLPHICVRLEFDGPLGLTELDIDAKLTWELLHICVWEDTVDIDDVGTFYLRIGDGEDPFNPHFAMTFIFRPIGGGVFVGVIGLDDTFVVCDPFSMHGAGKWGDLETEHIGEWSLTTITCLEDFESYVEVFGECIDGDEDPESFDSGVEVFGECIDGDEAPQSFTSGVEVHSECVESDWGIESFTSGVEVRGECIDATITPESYDSGVEVHGECVESDFDIGSFHVGVMVFGECIDE